jgi:galactokinase
LQLPAGVRVLGINSNVQHDADSPAYARARCAAIMAHRVILDAMQAIGAEAGRELTSDPMRGYLANLDPDDYKNIFRPRMPESMSGREFVDRFGAVPDPATAPEPAAQYPIRHAADHHVLEARRVRRFVEFLEQSHSLTGAKRISALNRAGHLMYASHQSYMMDAMLGAPGCDLLVRLVRDRGSHGLYGARITGGGEGGTVAILAGITSSADAAIDQVMVEYEKHIGHKPQALTGSSPGAWHAGTTTVEG